MRLGLKALAWAAVSALGSGRDVDVEVLGERIEKQTIQYQEGKKRAIKSSTLIDFSELSIRRYLETTLEEL